VNNDEPVPTWLRVTGAFFALAIIVPSTSIAGGNVVRASLSIGGAYITDARVLPHRAFDADVAVKGLAEFHNSSDRVTIGLGVTHVEFPGDDGSFEYGTSEKAVLHGAASKDVWVFMPQLRVRLLSLADRRVSLNVRGGLGYQDTKITLWGDVLVDQPPLGQQTGSYEPLPASSARFGDIVGFVGTGVDLAFSETAWIAIDWETTLPLVSESADTDGIGLIFVGIGHSFG
jgi:hypothetical protein